MLSATLLESALGIARRQRVALALVVMLLFPVILLSPVRAEQLDLAQRRKLFNVCQQKLILQMELNDLNDPKCISENGADICAGDGSAQADESAAKCSSYLTPSEIDCFHHAPDSASMGNPFRCEDHEDGDHPSS